MIKNVTIGSDIESFLQDLEGNLFPSCGLLGGTKDKPRSIGGGFFIQEDNVLLEGNIPVCHNESEFVDSVSVLLHKCSKQLPPSLRLKSGSSFSFPAAYVQWISQASVFGCDPDFNAWKMEQNPKPNNPKDPNFRTAAGHIHIGWEEPNNEDKINLIKWADICVSLPSISESPDRERRVLYGKAGAFRPKEYGVEHRTLDNYWIWNSASTSRIYQRYMEAINRVNNGAKIRAEDVEDIQTAINTYDVGLAKKLMKYYSV